MADVKFTVIAPVPSGESNADDSDAHWLKSSSLDQATQANEADSQTLPTFELVPKVFIHFVVSTNLEIEQLLEFVSFNMAMAAKEFDKDVLFLVDAHRQWSLGNFLASKRSRRLFTTSADSTAYTLFQSRLRGEPGCLGYDCMRTHHPTKLVLPSPPTNQWSYTEALEHLRKITSGSPDASSAVCILPISSYSTNVESEFESTLESQLYVVGGCTLCPIRDRSFLEDQVLMRKMIKPDGSFEAFEWIDDVPTATLPPFLVSQVLDLAGPIG